MNTKIRMVVAMNQDRVIGIDNKLPWHIPEDLKHFKEITLGKPVIMGRKTFESIGKALPGRRNLIVTKNVNYHSEVDGIEIWDDLHVAVRSLKSYDEICIIGGSEIFNQFMEIADILSVTIIHKTIEKADSYFPEIDEKIWNKTLIREFISVDGIKCEIFEYVKC